MKTKLKSKASPINDLLAPGLIVTNGYAGRKLISSLTKHDENYYKQRFST